MTERTTKPTLTSVDIDPHDLVLLRFLLESDDHAALGFWREWSDLKDIDDHSTAAYKLFPIVYQRLHAIGEEHPWMARLKGVYRRTWAINELAEATFAETAHLLAALHVPVLLSAESCSRSLGRTEVLTIEQPRVIVRHVDLPRALTCLLDSGWRTDRALANQGLRHRLTQDQWHLARPDGKRITLSTRFFENQRDPRGTEGVWNRAKADGYIATPDMSDLVVATLTTELYSTTELSWVIRAQAVLDVVGQGFQATALQYWTPRERELLVNRTEYLASIDDRFGAIAHSCREASTAAVVSKPILLRKAQTAGRIVRRWGGVTNTLAVLRLSRRMSEDESQPAAVGSA